MFRLGKSLMLPVLAVVFISRGSLVQVQSSLLFFLEHDARSLRSGHLKPPSILNFTVGNDVRRLRTFLNWFSDSNLIAICRWDPLGATHLAWTI